VRCPHCANILTVPASRTAAANPAPHAFDFDSKPSPFDAPDELPIGDRDGWRQTAAGLKTVWIGTCLQLLSVSTVFLAVVALATMGANAAGLLRLVEYPSAPVEAGQLAESVAHRGLLIGLSVVGLGAVIGTFLRIIGFARCLSIPPESGAGALSSLLVAVEFALAAGQLAIGLSAFLPPLAPLLGLGAAVLAPLLGLILLLLFLHRIGLALNSRQIPSGLFRFTVWLLAGVVGTPVLLGGQWLLVRLVSSGPPTEGKAWTELVGFVVMVLVGLTLGLTLLVKYLGLFNLARDEIYRRVGRR
jgi:hypothetical protein